MATTARSSSSQNHPQRQGGRQQCLFLRSRSNIRLISLSCICFIVWIHFGRQALRPYLDLLHDSEEQENDYLLSSRDHSPYLWPTREEQNRNHSSLTTSSVIVVDDVVNRKSRNDNQMTTLNVTTSFSTTVADVIVEHDRTSSTQIDHFNVRSTNNTTTALVPPAATWNETTRDDDIITKRKNKSVVHIINTRFMQHQANLLSLGNARLRIFKVFCLPTLLHQTSQNFLWIIRTDPQLHPTLKSQLLDLLRPYSHFILLAGNDNPENFRKMRTDIRKGHNNVLSGDIGLMKTLHQLSQNRTLLQTRLDADDGLHSHFVEYAQTTVTERFRLTTPDANDDLPVPNSKSPRWWVGCTDIHVEWHPATTNDASSDDDDAGMLRPRNVSGCITPGLTVALSPNVHTSELPTSKHHKLHARIRSCRSEDDTECLARWNDLRPGAVRVRSATSAGMADVWKVSSKERVELETVQVTLWNVLRNDMGIRRKEVMGLQRYLVENEKMIAEDNLKGQW